MEWLKPHETSRRSPIDGLGQPSQASAPNVIDQGDPVFRKLALALVALVGAFWLISTFALSYSSKTHGVDHLTDAFRPFFTNAAEKQSAADIAMVNNFAAEFQTKAVPALAKQAGLTPDQLVQGMSSKYPDVGKGLAQLPTILPYFNHIQQGLAAQQHNFHQADSIPTKSLPATSVFWLLGVIGVLTLAAAAIGLLARGAARQALCAGALLGTLVIVATVVLHVPGKAKAVDDMTSAFRPMFTTSGAAQTRQYLTTVEAMDWQLTSEALPGLAAMLNVTPAQLEQSLGQNFPAVAAALQHMPAILARFDTLVTLVQHNIGNFRKADSIPTAGLAAVDLQWQLVIPGALLVAAGLLGVARRRSASEQTVRVREPPR
jgi:hypothetical protein